jgi:hypothetical protein
MTNKQLDTWDEVEEAIREAFPGPSRKKFRAEIRRVAAEKQSIVGVWRRLATTALGDAAMREIERALERHRRKVEGASLAAATPPAVVEKMAAALEQVTSDDGNLVDGIHHARAALDAYRKAKGGAE